MESLYGGRQGASIIIVKHFDGIDIPQKNGSPVYRKREYAVDAEISSTDDATLLVDQNGKLIERNGKNTDLYAWHLFTLNGDTFTAKFASTGMATSPKMLPIELAEGMRQCFEKGGLTVDEVNYGESVIIDTIYGFGDYNNPDNGKVYRRGIDYNYNETTNPLAGAEYVGQITGPAGRMSGFGIKTEAEIKEMTGHQTQSYTRTNESLIPGKDVDEQGNDVFNDEISYSWVPVRDAEGTLQKYLFGFTIPYLVESFTASSVDAYYNRSNNTTNFDNLDLIEENDTSEHPFYKEWEIKVPKGIKGNASTNIELYPTYTKPGVAYWTSSSLEGDAAGVLVDSCPVVDYNPQDNYLKVQNDVDSFVYCKKETGWRQKFRYTETNFDRVAAGDAELKDIGEYNSVANVKINTDGELEIEYTYKDKENLGRVRGIMGGFHIIGNYDSIDDLYNIDTSTDPETRTAIPPEDLVTPSNPDYAGWCVTVNEKNIYAYDYINNLWYTIGNIVQALIDAGITRGASCKVLSSTRYSHEIAEGEFDEQGNQVYYDGVITTLGWEDEENGQTIDKTIQIKVRDGRRGPKGDPGEDGVSPVVSLNKTGKVTTLSIQDVEGIKEVEINDGADGIDGKTVYDIAVENGFQGTPAEWLQTLKGADGRGIQEIKVLKDNVRDNYYLKVIYSDGQESRVDGNFDVGIDIPIATMNYAGAVRPDGETIEVDGEGVLTVIGGGSGGGSAEIDFDNVTNFTYEDMNTLWNAVAFVDGDNIRYGGNS